MFDDLVGEHSPEILAELSKLGHTKAEDNSFVPGDDVLKALKAIRRHLNSSQAEIESRTLLEVHSISNHFIPLLTEHTDGVIVLEVMKIFVLLTLPDSPLSEFHCKELRKALSAKKDSNPAFPSIVKQLDQALEVDASKRRAEDKLPLDLFFWLIRNLLIGAQSDANFYLCLEREYVMPLCLHFTQHVNRHGNKEWDVVLTEIYFHFFSIRPLRLNINSNNNRNRNKTSESSHTASENSCKKLLQQVQQKKKLELQHLSTRHSHFKTGVFQTPDGQFVAQDSSTGALPFEFKASASVSARQKQQDTSALTQFPSGTNAVYASVEPFVSATLVSFLEPSVEIPDQVSPCSSLFSALIQAIQRQEQRFGAKEELHFFYLLRLTGCQGLDETNSTPATTLWVVTFLLNRMSEYVEQKAWTALELTISTLHRLLLTTSQLPLLLYELKEPLQLVPKLLRGFNAEVLTMDCLLSLCLMANFLLVTFEDLEYAGAVSKQRIKIRKREEKRKHEIRWNAEETYALAKGVEVHGHTLAAMRLILKDDSLKRVFHKDKTAMLMFGRWMYLRQKMHLGLSLEVICQSEIVAENDNDNDNDHHHKDQEEDEDKKPSKEDDDGRQEKKVDFFSELRPYLSNFVFRALSQLVDPGMYASLHQYTTLLNTTEVISVVALFFKRIRMFRKGLKENETLEPVLWHVENFSRWKRTLEYFAQYRLKNELRTVLESSFRRFFRMASKNSLWFVEILFWRTKAENIQLSREERVAGPSSKSKAKLQALEDGEEEEMLFLPKEEEEEEEVQFGVRDESADEEEEMSGNPSSVKNNSHENQEEEFDTAAAAAAVVLDTKPSLTPLAKSSDSKVPKQVRKRILVPSKRKTSLKPATTPVLDRSQLAKLLKRVDPHLRENLVSDLERMFTEQVEGDEMVLMSTGGAIVHVGLAKILLLLGMRPPNRILEGKHVNMFSCEMYWRLGRQENTSHILDVLKTEISQISENTGSDIEGDSDNEDDDDDDEVAWCFDEEENEEEDEEDMDSDNKEEEEEEEVVVPTLKKRRIVLSDSEEDD